MPNIQTAKNGIMHLEIARDLAYASMQGHQLALDLYWHPMASDPEPVVVWIHGGAWIMGDKSWIPPDLPLLDFGFAMSSIDYRLSQEAIFPAQIEDCKAAIRWLRANAERYNLDPHRVGVWGESVGGHLAALLGTAADVAEWDQQGGNQTRTSHVQAVCDCFGSSDLLQLGITARHDHNAADSPAARFLGGPIQENEQRAIQANPITHITPKAPPFLIMHGSQDDVGAVGQSELLHGALVGAGVESTLMIIPDMGHDPGWLFVK
ncbi:MAG: alpha/beta hydrolase [Chloroflexi bacterium]|nr:alpha/beta hydrolase [Chloroflexota bacterium]